MGIRKYLAIGLVSGVMSSLSYADDPYFQVGVGLFNQNSSMEGELDGEDISGLDLDATGLSFQVRSLFSEHFALDVGLQYAPYAELSRGNISRSIENLDTYTLYSNVLINSGIYENSLYVYTGVGYFADRWSFDGDSITARGLQLPIGLGYQFEKAAIELQVQFRDPDAYDLASRATNASLSVLASF